MISKFKFLVIVNIIIAVVFFAGVIAALYRVRDAVTWYGVHKVVARPTIVNYPSGYDVLKEINKYRNTNGIPDFVLYDPLCNNIGARWQNYKDTNSHAGLQEFADIYMPTISISEILVQGDTAEEMVRKWAGSPSHDIGLKTYSKICVYSAEGLSVALLSN